MLIFAFFDFTEQNLNIFAEVCYLFCYELISISLAPQCFIIAAFDTHSLYQSFAVAKVSKNWKECLF